MSKRQPHTLQWATNSQFLVPLLDGTAVVAQVISVEPEAMNSALCAFSSLRLAEPRSVHSVPVKDSDLLAILFVTRDLLDSGDWPVIGQGERIDPERYVPLRHFREIGFVGQKVIGSKIVRDFMNACFGLYPWNGFHDPEYLDRLLLSPNRKPKSVLLRE